MPTIPRGTQVKDLSTWSNRANAALEVLRGRVPQWMVEQEKGGDPKAKDSLLTAGNQNVSQGKGALPAKNLVPDNNANMPPDNASMSSFSGYKPNDNLGQRAFNPLLPLTPRYGPKSQEQRLGPRITQYPVGANIILTPRGEYGYLTPFYQLRNLASSYDIASMCIGTRIEEITGASWSVAPKNKRDKSRASECDDLMTFFSRPDGYTPIESWLAAVVREHLETDAVTIFPHMDYGGDLSSLEYVDGSTIKPLIDDRGRTLAYQQIIWGAPFSDYKRIEADTPDEEFPTFSSQELLYLPRFTTVRDPYGRPPTEWIILRVNMALRKQMWDMAWFTNGNIPDMIGTVPEGTMTPQQIQQLEEWLNATLEGDDAARRKIRLFPWGTNFTTTKEFSYDTAMDEFMMGVTCGAYAVPKTELGFTEDANRASSETQAIVNERRGLRPLGKWLKSSVFDYTIQRLMGGRFKKGNVSYPGKPTVEKKRPFSDLEWIWDYESTKDSTAQSQVDSTYEGMGAISADEVRQMRFGDTLDGPAPGRPGERTDAESPTVEEASAEGFGDLPDTGVESATSEPTEAVVGPQNSSVDAGAGQVPDKAAAFKVAKALARKITQFRY